MLLPKIFACCVVMLLSGCGVAISHARLKRHFKRDFVCPKAESHDWSDGYRIEGCRVVAYYWCEDNASASSTHTGRIHANQVAAGAVVGLFRLGWMGERCALDHHYVGGLELAADSGPEIKAAMEEVDRSYFRATAGFEGGHIELWKPRKLRQWTILKLIAEAPFSLADDGITMLRDDVPLTIAATQQTSDVEAIFLVTTEQLHALEQSRFEIRSNTATLPLDEEARRALATFDRP